MNGDNDRSMVEGGQLKPGLKGAFIEVWMTDIKEDCKVNIKYFYLTIEYNLFI